MLAEAKQAAVCDRFKASYFDGHDGAGVEVIMSAHHKSIQQTSCVLLSKELYIIWPGVSSSSEMRGEREREGVRDREERRRGKIKDTGPGRQGPRPVVRRASG